MPISHYFVDPAQGSDISGTGTIDNPWKTTQHALNNITRNSTDGDQINIRAGGTDVLADTLSLSVYGTPTYLAPLVLRGYANEPSDGGRGRLQAGGAFSVTSNTLTFTLLADLDIIGGADTVAVQTEDNCWLYRLNIDAPYRGIHVGQRVFVGQCRIRSNGNGPCCIMGQGAFMYNLVEEASLNAWPGPPAHGGYGLLLSGLTNTHVVMGNLIITNSNTLGGAGIRMWSTCPFILNNCLVNRAASGRGEGISITSVYFSGGRSPFIYNNIIANYAGFGGCGIQFTGTHPSIMHPIMVERNAFWNNATNILYQTKLPLISDAPLVLQQNPFVALQGGDFRLTDVAKAALRAQGWPDTFLDAGYGPQVSIGAIQYGLAEAGGMPSLKSALGRLRL